MLYKKGSENMSEIKTTETKQKIKSITCQNYCKKTDSCKEKKIRDCTKKTMTNFALCESYLVNARFIMF